MALQTTVIGSMPKPDYLGIPTWSEDGRENCNLIERYNNYSSCTKDIEEKLMEATREIITLQEKLGVDIITDGEMNRDTYIYHFCRKLKGVDFQHQKKKICRNGAWEGLLPTIVEKIGFRDDHISSARDWIVADGLSSSPVKYTLPGPMTIADTMVNEFYQDENTLYEDLIYVINAEVKALANAGCKFIQIDEPVFVRYPEKAASIGIHNLSRCFEGLPDDTSKIVHICCGNPTYLDQPDYEKADKNVYLMLAAQLDNAGFDTISIEDAHQRNHSELFKKFQKTKIILGVIDVAKSRIETVEEIQAHIKDVLQYVPRERLIIAPDCGMVFLTRDMVLKKLKNMVTAARSI